MEAYKPLLTKKGLKTLCDRKRRIYKTPLKQTREAIKNITNLREERLYQYASGEWQEEPENYKYMKIAKEYYRRVGEQLKIRKEAKAKLNDKTY